MIGFTCWITYYCSFFTSNSSTYHFCRLDCVNHCLEKESISDEDQDEESAKSGGAGIHQDINDNLNLRSLSSGGSRVYQGRFDESFGTGSINCR